MRPKNFIKAAQGTHPPKSGNFSGNSLIKYLFLAVNYCTRNPLFVQQSSTLLQPQATVHNIHNISERKLIMGQLGKSKYCELEDDFL
jgi:hypothetical protein